MKPWNPTSSQGLLLAAAISAVAASATSLLGGFDAIGITGLAPRIGITVSLVVIITAGGVLAQLSSLTYFFPKPICTLRESQLGIVSSVSAVRHANAEGVVPYVPRDSDAGLRRLMEDHRFVIIEGPSGSGKTRSAYQAAVDSIGDLRVLYPKRPGEATASTGSLDELLQLTTGRFWRPRLILWLDELEQYLTNALVDFERLVHWLDGHDERIIIATITPAEQTRLNRLGGAVGKNARAVTKVAEVHLMDVRWSNAEQARARQTFPDLSDDKIARLAHYFAFDPVLEAEYRNAPANSPDGWIVINTLTECERAGWRGAVPRDLLLDVIAADRGEDTDSPDIEEVLTEGIEWATRAIGRDEPGEGRVALVYETPPGSDNYIAAESVRELAHGQAEPPSRILLQRLLLQARDARELLTLATRAGVLGYGDVAQPILERIFRSETTSPDIQVAARQAWMRLHEFGSLGDGQPMLLSPNSEPLSAAGRSEGPAEISSRRPIRVLATINRSAMAKAVARVGTLFLVDVVGLWLALLAATLTVNGQPYAFDMARRVTDERIPYVALLVVISFNGAGLYRQRARRANLARLFAAIAQAGLVFIALWAFGVTRAGSISLILLTIALAAIILSPLRALQVLVTQVLYRLALGGKPRRVFVGSHDEVARVSHFMGSLAGRYEVLGWISTNGAQDDVAGLPCVGAAVNVRRLASELAIDEFILCSDSADEDIATELVDLAYAANAQVRAITRRANVVASSSRYVPGDPLPMNDLRAPTLDTTQWSRKRPFDILGAIALLIISAPLWLPAALLVRLSSLKDRVLVQVSNAGMSERLLDPNGGVTPFGMYKFRTAYVALPGMSTDKEHLTSIGRLLRRFGVDELPQLLNVIKARCRLLVRDQ